MKFYYSTATCSTLAHIALEEVGVKFTPIEVSWKRNVNVEALNQVSPLGAVPVLSVDGKVLTQNAAILEYIADGNPSLGFLPKAGTFERAEAMSWISLATADLQKSFGPILGAQRLTSIDAAKTELKAYGIKNVQKYLTHIDAALNGRDYIMGKDYSFADSALFVFIGWCKWAEIKTSEYKNINPFMKRVYQRPAVQKVLASEGLMDYLPE